MNNKITDYISGTKVNATPEELEAVQPLAQELVEVYGYNKDQIKKSLQKTVIGSTNEPDIAKNVLKILFCKIFDERYQSESGFVDFYVNAGNFQENSKKVRTIFTKVKNKFEDVFDKSEEIKLD